ncbi:MAG: AarF/ABC1/UbiB kinase family protein [Myxococcales bacterium]|nr:AarF/ABC1/UbiB kinase family protein [Myxococcales bacterium]
MLNKKWIPTRLVEVRSRPVIREISKPSRFRPWKIAWTVSRSLMTLLFLRMARRSTPLAKAAVVRRMLEELGGLWVKVGQLISMRRDLFSDEFCDAMAALQDHATGFPFHYAREAIETDLGRTISSIFSEFDERPFAAASIGQIYRGRLRENGVLVAVKIKRPNVDAMVKGDIAFVRAISWLATKTNFYPPFRWADFAWELDKTLSEELDYRYEANYIRRMRKNLKAHKVYAPKIFRKYCAERVLVMEFVTGVLMSDVLRLQHTDPKRLNRWLAENNVIKAKVGRKLAMSLNRQLFEDNLFHGDLHPGNIVLLKNSRVSLIDFGSVGWLEREFLERYDQVMVATAERQYGKVADLFMLLSPNLPPIDLEPCKRELIQFMRSWANRAEIKALPFSEKSMGYGYTEMARIFVKYRIPTAWTFLRINRAEVTLDTSLRELYPKMNYFKVVEDYTKERAKRELKGRLSTRALLGRIGEMALKAPDLIQNTLEETAFQVEWVRRRARVFETATGKAAFIGKAISSVMALFAIGALGGLFTLYAHQQMRSVHFSPEMTAWLDQAPNLPKEIWYTILGGLGLIGLQLVRIRRKLAQPDPAVTQGSKG